MNKQELKRLIEKTCVMIGVRENKLIDPWIKIVESLGLDYKVVNWVGGKVLCVVTQSGALEFFDSQFIHIKFPTLEQFLKDGNHLHIGDAYVEGGCVISVDDILGEDVQNSPEDGDNKRYVIFAKCWLDEDKQEAESFTKAQKIFNCKPNILNDFGGDGVNAIFKRYEAAIKTIEKLGYTYKDGAWVKAKAKRWIVTLADGTEIIQKTNPECDWTGATIREIEIEL